MTQIATIFLLALPYFAGLAFLVAEIRRLIRAINRIERSTEPGRPFMIGDHRVGTIYADGSISFEKGIRATRLAPEHPIQPDQNQNHADKIEQCPHHVELSGV